MFIKSFSTLLSGVPIGLVLMAIVFSACAKPYILTDITGKQIEVKHVKIGSGVLEVWQGDIYRKIAIKNIQSLVFYPSVIATRNNKVVYEAEIILKDGYHIKTDIRGLDTSYSYVAVDPMLIAKSSMGRIEMPLHKVREMALANIDNQ